MIKATDLWKSYNELDVLKGVSLNIKKGEVVSVVGASGVGKSTLLHILGTLSQADKGTVIIDGQSIEKLKLKEIGAFRNEKIGFIFQSHQLLPEFTALENVCLPSWIKGNSQKYTEKKAKEILSNLGLLNRIYHKPSELSGGEQQRVSVARALINNPAVILADEPSGNLDTKSAKLLHELFFELRDMFHQTFVIVTHNRELAKMSDRIIEMKDGIIIK